MKRHGQTDIMPLIIAAAIALVVLVVLLFIFTGKFRNVDDGTSCSGVGGRCEEDCSLLEGYFQSSNQCSEGTVCCMRLSGQAGE